MIYIDLEPLERRGCYTHGQDNKLMGLWPGSTLDYNLYWHHNIFLFANSIIHKYYTGIQTQKYLQETRFYYNCNSFLSLSGSLTGAAQVKFSHT